ncbi:S-adenosylmethionine decarboxylase proenzyme [Musa troglodytarum]|uniref:S-adenosylmethionine decarboxylase proenzyme n=1 Tax=Musa troglodytarum TaxID=320322 RepID=A0A9E7GHJ6_9LILI|nr:S-adenosylmethionine decarboxylase proenzyme [Musa troglodytarum]
MAEEAPANVFVPPTKCLPKSPFPPPPLSVSSSGRMTRLLIPLAVLSYLLSLPVLGLAVWLLATRDYNCEDLMQAPQIRTAIGVGLILVFAISNFVVYFGPRILMPCHVILSVVLVVMLSSGVSLVGLYKTETRGLPGTPMWLRSRVMNVGTWVEIKNCLYDDRICLDMAYRSSQFTSGDFIMMKLSAVESGCCKPPEICGMEYVNATYWTSATRKDANDERSVRDPTPYGGGWPLPPYKCDVRDSHTALIPLLVVGLVPRVSAIRPKLFSATVWLLGFRDLSPKFPWVAAFRHRSSLVLLLGSRRECLMESKGRKKKSSSSNSLDYEVPLGYSIEDIRPHGGIKKFQSAAYSNCVKKPS